MLKIKIYFILAFIFFSALCNASEDVVWVKMTSFLLSEPDIDSATIEVLKAGNKLTLVSKKDQNWLKIKNENGKIGWVNSNWVSTEPVESSRPTNPIAVSAQNLNGDLIGEYDETVMDISYIMKLHVDNGKYYLTSVFKDGSGETKLCESNLISRGVKLVCTKNRFGDYYIFNENGDLEEHDSQGIIDVLKNKIKSGVNDKYQKSSDKESCFSLGYRYGKCAGLVLKGLPCPPEDDFEMPERCRNKAETQKGIESGLGSVW